MFFSVLALAVALQQTPDPLLLPIGGSKKVKVSIDKLTDLRTGKEVTPSQVAVAARTYRYVYLGESHDNALHHKMQADMIRALVVDGRDVVVGMEMFTRPVQQNLAGWTLGWYNDDQFIEKSDWKKQWGFDYALYKPIFDAAKELKLPLVALNVPRDWVRAVGKSGYAALTPEQKAELPSDLFLGNREHRSIFTAMMGGHPMTGDQGENIYSAQVLWDEGMADTAIRYMAGRVSQKTIMVVIAGSGHVMYGQGINYRVKRHIGEDGITMVMGEADADREVSSGVGDFFYLTRAKQ